MSTSEVPVVRRPRPPLIATLRILLPAVAVATLLAVIGAAILSAWRGAENRAEVTRPIELIGPQLSGEDSKNRPFVITSATAERELGVANRIRLHDPVLVRDPGAADQMKVTAKSGVYDETAGRLDLSGDVKFTSPNGTSTTQAATYDARTGEVLGAAAVQAAGAAGQQLQAGSFAVKDKGDSVVYKGGVHTRLNTKK
jgi:lipopolysaccharide export system protein LptC